MDWGCHRSSVPRCCCQSIPWGWDVWGSPSDASDCCRVTLPHLQRQILWSIQFFFRLWDRHPCARARKWAVTYRLPLGIFQPAVKIADKKKEMFVNACSRHLLLQWRGIWRMKWMCYTEHHPELPPWCNLKSIPRLLVLSCENCCWEHIMLCVLNFKRLQHGERSLCVL